MADKISFLSAQLISFSRKITGGEAKFSASLSTPVQKALGWTDIPAFLTSCKPEGEIAGATTMEIMPKDAELRKFGRDLQISKVHGFELLRLEIEGKRDKGHRIELRFSVSFQDQKGARILEEYLMTAGEAKSTVTVSYVKQGSLTMVDMTAEPAEDAQQTLASAAELKRREKAN